MRTMRFLLIVMLSAPGALALAGDDEQGDIRETVDLPRHAVRVAPGAPVAAPIAARAEGVPEDPENADTIEEVAVPVRDHVPPPADVEGPMPAVDPVPDGVTDWRWVRPVPRTLGLLRDAAVVDVEFTVPVTRAEVAALTVDPGLLIANGRVDEIDIRPSQRGTWVDLEDGGRVWTMAFVSETADWMRFRIDPFVLPPGAQLVLFSATQPEYSYGPYTEASAIHNAFWTPLVFGSEARLELYVPADAEIADIDAVLRITRVVQGFNPPAADGGDKGGGPDNPLACQLDVMCDATWNGLAPGVAHIQFVSGGGSFICTGSMVNRLNSDLARIFLTAAHCINSESEANSMVAFWFYQSDSCNGTVPPLGSVPQTSGATLLATKTITDVTILGLTDDIPGGMLWEGWDVNSIPFGTPGVLIHHPQGVRKSISYGVYEGRDDNNCSAGSYQYRLDLTDGGQEGGSSGCPGFDSNQRTRTVATCSQSGCSPGENTWEGSLPDSYDVLQPFWDPQTTVWVDIGYGGTEKGTAAQPWDTIIEGYYGVLSGGTINIDAGTYPAQIIRGYRRNMLLRGVNGSVLIGG